MDTTEETAANSPPPLDPSFAPALLFNCGPGSVGPEKETSGVRLLYSIPKKRLVPARGFQGLAGGDDINWVTPQGWVLTVDAATRGVSLRDPFASRTAVSLPPDTEGFLASSGEDTRCVMSTDRPTDPGRCVVVVVHRTDPVLRYCRPGSSSHWLRHEYHPESLVDGDTHGRESITKAIYVLTAAGDNRFYTHISWEDKLVALTSFSPLPSLSSSHARDWPFPAGCSYTEHCLVSSCGDLFMVQFCYTRPCDRRMLLVEVKKKMELAKNVFVKVADLGDNRVFFVRLGQFGASMAADQLGLKPNCIYFTNCDDKGLYVYDMEQGTTSLHNPGPDVPDYVEPILLMPVT